MKLDKKQIENNINWLVSNGSPAVKYLTHKYLLKSDPCSKAMKKLWTEVEKCRAAEEIFSKQHPDGSWCSGGSWASGPSYIPKDGYSAFTPKYVTTVWILPILGDMDFDIHDPRVRKACEYTLLFQNPKGQFNRFKVYQATQIKSVGLENGDPANAPCTSSVYLSGLGAVVWVRIFDLKNLMIYLSAGSERTVGGSIKSTRKNVCGQGVVPIPHITPQPLYIILRDQNIRLHYTKHSSSSFGIFRSRKITK